MKKQLLLILLAATAASLHAQSVSMDFIPFHYPGYDIHQFDCKVMQQSDGNLVANVLVSLPSDPGGDPPIIVGNSFYKVSPTQMQIIDSLFLVDSIPPFYTLLKDSRGEGNLRINIEPESNGGTALRISHFSDDNLQINHDEDVMIHLHDSTVFNQPDDIVIDSQNDLIVKYYTSRPSGGIVCHIARYGLDGTLKHTNVLPEIQNYLNNLTEIKSHPKQYYQWKTDTTENMYVFVIDSIFNQENYYVVNRVLDDHMYFEIYNDDTLYAANVFETYRFNSPGVIIDDGDLVIAAPYTWDSAWVYDYEECGMVVARYNLRTMQRKALVHFNDWPGPSTDARCLGFQKAWNGDLYLVYREPTPQNAPTMTAVKMDRGLNVIWKRYCYDPQSFKVDPYYGMYSGTLDDVNGNETGMFIAGYSSRMMDNKDGFFYFFLDDEGLTTVDESGIIVRPYAYYPNPAKDQLHLQFSPDVTPTQIELYDLQGRLVRTQRNGLERLEMNGLAAGTYTMRVTLEDGKVFSDKVVKE